jgi:predicted HTH domain antitoxin
MTIHVPYDVFINLRKSLAEAAQDILRQAAIRYYKTRVLSLGKAAELAGMTRFECIDYLRFNQETIFDYTEDELAEIQDDASKLEEMLS